MRIAINIATRDRPTELALLLQSLRTQTYQDFDIFILEDCSGTPWQNYHFLNMIIARLKLENHKVFIGRSPFNYGVSKARQVLCDKSAGYPAILRVDDDVILEPEYISKLVSMLDCFDIASGVTPALASSFKRNSECLDLANQMYYEDGRLVYDGDDCGIEYIGDKIVPAHHFRSCALIKKEVHDKVKYYPTKLTKHGFREETLLSLKARMLGFKIGVNLQAKAWHLMTPSGGERFADSQELANFNQKMLNEFLEENKDELIRLADGKPISKNKRMSETNLIR